MTFKDRIINEISFLKEGRIICACSGGVDSTVLAHILKSTFNDAKIHVLIINHNLRANSKIESEAVKDELIKSGFEIVNILEWKHDVLISKIEEEARRARHELIFTYAIENNINTVFFGHHYNDVEENFFLKLGMGAGLFGISQLKKERRFRCFGKFFNLVRPLLFESKKDILLFAKQNNIFFVTDESNKDDKFKRNRIRSTLSDLEISKNQFLNSLKDLGKMEVIIKNNLSNIFKEKLIFNKECGFFSADFFALQELLKEELILCLKQIVFYFTEKCELRAKELETAIFNIALQKGFTLGGMEVFFKNNDIFFIKEYAKIKHEIKHGVWDLRFNIMEEEKNQMLLNLPFKIIKTLPFFKKHSKGGYFLPYKIKPVQFEISQ